MSAGDAAQPVRPRTPPGVGTPLRADGRPGQRHPSSHDVPNLGGEKKQRAMGGVPLGSQNAHDETVLVRCAHDGAPHPQPL